MFKPLLLSLLLAATGCTLDPGRGFAQLSAGLWSSFRALDPAQGRVLAGGWLKTSSSYALQLSQLELAVRELRLRRAGATSATASTGSCSFDPQSPPFGCTLCHGEHCHCDGKLRSYDELRAELCGGGGGAASAVIVVRLPVLQPQALLGTGTRQELASCVPSCELGAGTIDELQLVLERLRLSGTVRDESNANRLGGRQPKLAVDLPLGGAALSLKLASAGGAVAIGHDQPYYLTLSASLPVSEKLLDGVAWEGLGGGESIVIDDKQNSAAGEALLQGLTATTLGVQTTRGED